MDEREMKRNLKLDEWTNPASEIRNPKLEIGHVGVQPINWRVFPKELVQGIGFSGMNPKSETR
jgi:hypothetical protein